MRGVAGVGHRDWTATTVQFSTDSTLPRLVGSPQLQHTGGSLRRLTYQAQTMATQPHVNLLHSTPATLSFSPTVHELASDRLAF